MKNLIFLGILTFTSIIVSPASGGITPIKPYLGFRTEALGTLEHAPEIADLSSASQFLEPYLAPETMTTICSVGVWMYYEQPNFLGQTVQIGENEAKNCSLMSKELKARLLEIILKPGSYRQLGPRGDLSVNSVTIYSEENFRGPSGSLLTGNLSDIVKGDPNHPEIPGMTVKSFVITSPTDDDATDNRAEGLKTVVKVFEETGYQTTKSRTCYALVSEPTGTPVKFFLYPQVKAPPEDETFGSLQMYTFSQDLITTGACKKSQAGVLNPLVFTELPKPAGP